MSLPPSDPFSPPTASPPESLPSPPTDSPGSNGASVHDPYVALRQPNYRRYFIGNAAASVGSQMAAVTVGWELYARTNSAVALGMVGLVQVVPIVGLALPAGHLVDRLNRKMLIMASTVIVAVCYVFMALASRYSAHLPNWAAANLWLTQLSTTLGDKGSHFDDPYVPILFLLLLVIGVARSINQPAKWALMPMLVEARHFSNAVTWNSSLFETSNVVGPMIAGFTIAGLQARSGSPSPTLSPNVYNAAPSDAYGWLYGLNAVCQLMLVVSLARVYLYEAPRSREPVTLKSLLAGVRFVRGNKIILGAITLDMFAVLLGGATALLPVFAKDILKVGPIGLGWLRAAPSIGAMTMAMVQAHRQPMRHAGRNLLWAVAGFGAATIVFGLSHNFWLSMAALILTGAFDNISVVVRHTLVQLRTPDDMRGRVNAVNSVFISSSNELGAFESGVTAALGIRYWGAIWGPMLAVAAGGVGTIFVVAIIALCWPELGAVRFLHAPASTDETDP